MNLQTICRNTEALIKEAGAMMISFEIQEIKEKGDVANIVTDMDIKVQKFLIEGLKDILPNSDFLAEEENVQGDTDGYLWIIDPIDGTSNYAYGFKHSAISIALSHHGKGIMGVVYNPYLDELFTAIHNDGAFLNHVPIQVQQHDLRSSLTICGTCPYEKEYANETFEVMKQLFVQGRDIRRSGSAVLDLCYVAAGRCDAFYEYHLSPWDYAAASIIIKEAGGIVDAIGAEFNILKRVGIIAGNVKNIEAIKTLVYKVHEDFDNVS